MLVPDGNDHERPVPAAAVRSWLGRKIYQYVIEKERRGDYLGKTVQVCTALRL